MSDKLSAISDPARLAALRQTMLLDTPPEPTFDRITQLAAKLLGTPVALISLVDIDRQFFKSILGLPEPWKSQRQTPLTHSFCKHVVHSGQTLVVNDSRENPLVLENLAVRDLNVIAYMGAPLLGLGGQPIGALCAIDGVPRSWTPEQAQLLNDLAAFVVAEIGARRATDSERSAEKALNQALMELEFKEAEHRLNSELRFLADAMPQIVWTSKPEGGVDYYNQRWFDYTGFNFEQTKDQGWAQVMHPDDLEECAQKLAASTASGKPFEAELRLLRARDSTYRWHLARSVPMRHADGTILRWVGTSTDIHDQKQTSTALKDAHDQLEQRVRERTAQITEQQQFLQAVLDSITDGIIACDHTGTVTLRNRAMRELHGGDTGPVKPEDMARTHRLFKADGVTPLPTEQVPLVRAFGGMTVKDEELVIGLPDGVTKRRLVASGRAIVDSNGNRLGAVIAAQDITERAAAEQKFRMLFDCSSDAHLLVNETGTVDCNKAAVTLLGFSDKQQLLSVHPAGFSPVFQRNGRRSSELRFEMDQIAVRLGSHRFEWTLRRQDGAEVPVEVTLTSVDFDGEKALLAVVHDLTERNAAQLKLQLTYSSLANANLALRQSEERFTAFMDNSPAVCYIKDADSRLVYVNRQFETLFNVKGEQLVGKTDYDLLSPSIASQVAANDQLVLQSGKATEFIESVPFANGENRSWLSLKFPLVSSSKSRLLGGVSFDITARVNAEAQIDRQRQFTQAVLENLTDGVIACDTAGRITYCNTTLLKMQGIENLPEEPSSQWATEHLALYEPTGRRLSWDERPLALALKNICVDATELLIQPANASSLNIIVSARPMADKDGNIIGAVAAWHDVTDLRRSQQELLVAKEAADKANQAKSEFLANMSHEIRTPMTAILGYTDLLADPAQSARQRAQHVQVVRRNGQHLMQLLSDILDLSKIEAREMTLERVAFNPLQLLREVETLLRPHATGKNISLQTKLQPRLPRTVISDPTRLKQILLNLIGNALKFTDRGGVKVAVDFQESEHGSMLVFKVSDTGIGMTAQQQENLFHPFRQADGSTTRRFGGTGLGLAICKRLAHMLGGELTVISQAGKGSTFTLGMPVELEHSDAALPMVPTAVSTCPVESIKLLGKILIAEDGVDNQRLARLYLEAAGLKVETAINGRVAVDSVKRADVSGEPFDAVLMDMQMPELDGYGATAQLRRMGYAALPIIAFTAHALASERETCIRSGCTDYVTKPIDRGNLLQTLSKYLPAADADLFGTVHSDKATDPLISTILADYIDGLPEHVLKINHLLTKSDLRGLRLIVHQLKGSGGSYGFPEITNRARSAEAAITGKEPIERIAAEVQSLVELIRRVEGYNRAVEEPSPSTFTDLAASAASSPENSL